MKKLNKIFLSVLLVLMGGFVSAPVEALRYHRRHKVVCCKFCKKYHCKCHIYNCGCRLYNRNKKKRLAEAKKKAKKKKCTRTYCNDPRHESKTCIIKKQIAALRKKPGKMTKASIEKLNKDMHETRDVLRSRMYWYLNMMKNIKTGWFSFNKYNKKKKNALKELLKFYGFITKREKKRKETEMYAKHYVELDELLGGLLDITGNDRLRGNMIRALEAELKYLREYDEYYWYE